MEFNDLINKNTKLKKNFQKFKTKIKSKAIAGITISEAVPKTLPAIPGKVPSNVWDGTLAAAQ